MGASRPEDRLKTRGNTNSYLCLFVLHNYCKNHNVYVDLDVVNSQIPLMRRNEVEFRDIPEPVYSSNEGEGKVVRTNLTGLIL